MTAKYSTDVEFVRAYTDEKLTVKQMVERFGYASHAPVCRRLRQLGVDPRPHPQSDVSLTEFQTLVLEGSILGDASIRVQGSGNAYVKFAHSIRQEEYVQWLHQTMQPFSRNLGEPYITHDAFRTVEFVTATLPVFRTFYDRFYPSGKKLVPRDLVLNPVSLAVWFMDDGSSDRRWRRLQFSSCSFSEEDNHFLLDQLRQRFGLKGSVNWVSNMLYRKIVLSAKSFTDFRDIVWPYIIPSMRYKLDY